MNMFDPNFWSEIWQTIRSQRLRSVMTAFGVFWGIFILTLLIGSGMALDNGIAGKVKSMPKKLLWIVPQQTSIAYHGFGRDRSWKLNLHDAERIRQTLGTRVTNVSPIVFADYQNVTNGMHTYQHQVAGMTPQCYGSLPQKMTAGRYLNDIDMAEHRKVCVLGVFVAEELFGSSEEAVGNTVVVNGTPLTVVGVTKCTNKQFNIGIDVSESVYIPIPTGQITYGRGDEVDAFIVILTDDSPMERYESVITGLIKENHDIHPDDPTAMLSVSLSDQTAMYLNIFTGVNLLIWIIGIGTLIGGLIGITNIMLVTIRERTKEIGIRRALGAKPPMIVRQIMMESLLLTMAAGLAGLCLAVWLLHAVDALLPDDELLPFVHPYMPFWTAVISLFIIISGGLFAGWLPTRRALRIKPIDALRDE